MHMEMPESADAFLPHEFGSFTAERRRSHREQVVAIARLTPADASDQPRCFKVLVVDVSLHGCDFLSAACPRDGAYYHIDMTVGPLCLKSRLRVIRIAPRQDGTYEIGSEFI